MKKKERTNNFDWFFFSLFVKYSGYMSKEYAMDNIISDKLDVFSFGAMILEIITGRQNLKFCNSHPGDSLLDLVRLIIYQYKIDFIFNICIWEELLEVILKRITSLQEICTFLAHEKRYNKVFIAFSHMLCHRQPS